MKCVSGAPRRAVAACALAAVFSGLLGGAAAPARAGTVEVLHWWTAGGEAKSVAELRRMLQSQGHVLKDFTVAGGGGDSAIAALKVRVRAGDPPGAAQIKGPAIGEYGRMGVLANLDDIAARQSWDSQLPGVVASVMKYQGHYVAVPVNVHRVNMMWINAEALRRINARPPQSWEDFFRVADRLQHAGIVPVAHGGQPWQELLLFENVALGVGGADFFRRAFVDLDAATLNGPVMERVLTTFRRIKPYTDKGSVGRDWNKATAMVMKGEAAIQFMGDWAKGEFRAAGQVPGKEFLCIPTPGTERAYIFNIDSFALFQLKDPTAMVAQSAFVSTVMSPGFQEIFNLSKGSIPAVTGGDRKGFDRCSQESSAHFVASSLMKTAVPSVSSGMVQNTEMEGSMKQAVADFWNDDRVSAEATMGRLAALSRKK
ncbi:MAG: ABC transporter substrate-binding protein [Rhizobacter sp.]